MKILLCTSTFDTITHGPAKFAQLLLQINDRYPEHEVRILTEGVKQEIPNSIYKIQPKYLRIFQALWPFLNNYSYYKAAMQIRKEYPFDILMFNNAVMGFWPAFKKDKDFKVVGMINDDDYLSARLSNCNFSKKWLINFHRKPLERFAAKNLNLVIANSDYIKKAIKKEYKTSAFRLYKSIDLSNFTFQEKKEIDLSKSIKILFVKSDYPRGGLKLLIDSLSQLRYSFELLIIGPKIKDQPIVESYFKNVENVSGEFKGPCDQKTVIEFIRAADIFSVPAHKEGLGIANIEALAAGIPVVSTTVGGIPEVLDFGQNGWLSPKDTPADLAKTFQACIESSEERKAKSKKGRKFVEANFSHEQMLDNFVKKMESLFL